jgi:hypothetical protein
MLLIDIQASRNAAVQADCPVLTGGYERTWRECGALPTVSSRSSFIALIPAVGQ